MAELCFACTEREYAVPAIDVTCTICKKAVSWREAVKHYAEHGKRSGDTVACPLCGAKVKSREYRRHVRMHFVKRRERGYMCGVCGRSFITLRSLLVHIQKMHE